ncbi:MAG: GNAT family N-acetyltransferase [Hyphomicrobiales bacterium]|nr:MAG: GNAT family N-acetyltransferase [Hyphomicrobiales bacterium]
MSVRVAVLTGEALVAALPALARLRIEVFRAFPYLYDGTLEYERGYLETFARAEGAIIVAAQDGDEIVGCATGAPMAHVDPAFAAPFLAHGYDVSKIFYCGESVLRSKYRGLGIGHRFFDEREAQAVRLGNRISTFCAVARPSDHPLAPKDYVPLDAFWTKRGYAKASGFTTRFGWKDIDSEGETDKLMQFWMKDL